MKVWLDTLQNVVGVQGLKSVLNYAHLEKYIDNFPPSNYELEVPLEDLRNLFFSFYEVFGGKGIYGLQLRVGRERARIVLEEHTPFSRIAKVAARLFPEQKKMRTALKKTKEETEQLYPTQIKLHEEESSFLYIDEANFESEGVMSNRPVCGVFVGTLQYIMEWVTGRPHNVEEIECRAMGHPADVFRVAKARTDTGEQVRLLQLHEPYVLSKGYGEKKFPKVLQHFVSYFHFI